MKTSNGSRGTTKALTTIYLFSLLVGVTIAFSPSRISITSKTSSSTRIMANDNASGSFFNPVPDPKDDDGEDDPKSDAKPPAAAAAAPSPPLSGDPFEDSLAAMINKRTKKPLASQPSTLGGIPTAKATGFGKTSKNTTPQIINTSKTNSASPKSFVGIGKKLNDVNNPEYDDQGYTLYANEETGEKQRVFEALVEYPCDFKMKIIGANEGTFAKEMVAVVAESCRVEADTVKFSERVNGKWMSVTVMAPVESAEMLYTLYENIDRDPRVKFKF